MKIHTSLAAAVLLLVSAAIPALASEDGDSRDSGTPKITMSLPVRAGTRPAILTMVAANGVMAAVAAHNASVLHQLR